jgi:hypothetical protein
MERISIKSLARELDVTSRAVIDRCRSEGLWVQNSITKLTPKQAEMVRSWFRTGPEELQNQRRPRGPEES